MLTWQLHCGSALEVLKTLPDQSVNCVVTSPPYWGLRNYGVEGQLGMEATPAEYVTAMVAVFAEIRRVLVDDGTVFGNWGDTYIGGGRGGNPDDSLFRKQATNAGSLVERTAIPSGYKPKDLAGIPWSVAFALRNDGWYLRSEIIWHKKSCMPESVKDRPTKAHEQVFLLTKQPRYFYDADAIREKYAESTLEQIEAGYDGEGQKDYASAGVQNPSGVKARIVRGVASKWAKGHSNDAARRMNESVDRAILSGEEHDHPFGLGANARTVWSLGPEPATDVAHFAVMPKTLARRCIMAGCPFGGTVLDPFAGSGTTGIVALEEGRSFIGIELNEKYHALARKRLEAVVPLLATEVPCEPTPVLLDAPQVSDQSRDGSTPEQPDASSSDARPLETASVERRNNRDERR